MSRAYKPYPKPYTETAVVVAIQEVENGASVRPTAHIYYMFTSMLRKRVLGSKGLITQIQQDLKLRLPAEMVCRSRSLCETDA